MQKLCCVPRVKAGALQGMQVSQSFGELRGANRAMRMWALPASSRCRASHLTWLGWGVGAVTGALIGTKVTNASGTATQPFTFTLPGNYTIVANVSQQDTSQYGLAATTTQAYVLDQTTITLTATQAAAGAATVSVRTKLTMPCCPPSRSLHQALDLRTVVRGCECQVDEQRKTV